MSDGGDGHVIVVGDQLRVEAPPFDLFVAGANAQTAALETCENGRGRHDTDSVLCGSW